MFHLVLNSTSVKVREIPQPVLLALVQHLFLHCENGCIVLLFRALIRLTRDQPVLQEVFVEAVAQGADRVVQ